MKKRGIKGTYFVYCCLLLEFLACAGGPVKAPPTLVGLDKSKYLDGGSMEYVTFFTPHGTQVSKAFVRNGILFKNPRAKATVLVCHGFMCDKFDTAFLRRFIFSNYNVMIFDFRAHGEHIDSEQCCTFGRDEAYDVIGAVSYIKSRQDLNNLPLIAYGFSMGAVAAIQAQATMQELLSEPEHQSSLKITKNSLFDALILDCPYDHSENVIKQCLGQLKITILGYTFNLPGKSLLERYAYNHYVQKLFKVLLKTISHMDPTATNTYIYPVSPAESVKKITIPCFFIHCYNDEKVPVGSAHALYNNIKGYKRLWITQGRRHFDSIFFNSDKYVYKINRFIQQLLDDQLSQKVNQEKIISDIKA